MREFMLMLMTWMIYMEGMFGVHEALSRAFLFSSNFMFL